MHRLTLFALFISGFPLIFCEKSMGSPRIAIVGAGIGGASASYYLRSLFGDHGAAIRVYEAKQIGGRLATAFVNNLEYEVGGSVIHPKNKYMVDFVKLTDLEMKQPAGEGQMGLYDGRDFVFRESNWQFVTLLRMLWRYGVNLFKWEKLMDDTMFSFSKIYDLQDKNYAFTTPEKMLSTMSSSFVNITQTTIKKHLEKLHFSESFIEEMVTAITRVNYGQSVDINGFVGQVAMAGATPGLWSVAGGNKQVAERLLQKSNAEIVHETVTEVVYRPSEETFEIVSTSSEPHNGQVPSFAQRREEYDAVIIAVPLIDQVSNITFLGFPKPIKNFEGKYHRTVTTLVEGDINKKSFNLEGDEIDSILTINPDLDFNSLSKIQPLEENKSEYVQKLEKQQVWKVFSQQPLTLQQLDHLFETRREVQVIDWLAYPHYTPPEKFDSFVLNPNLPIFYTSAIEWAASAMEMSCIAGRNAALLLFQTWHDNLEKIDFTPKSKSRRTRNEL